MSQIPEYVRLQAVITRRATIAGGLALCGCTALHAREPRGCWASASEAASLLEEGKIQLFETGNEPIIASSGDADLDLALAITLADLGRVFNVLPGFGYYDERGTENARATSDNLMKRTDGTVLMGRKLLRKLLQLPEAPDACIISVCAHEFGHIVQYKYGHYQKLSGRPTVKRGELHADFLAGYYSGTRKLKRESFPAAVFAMTQFNFGTDDYSDPNFHGTGEERGAAVARGFQVAYTEKRTAEDAAKIGIEYVSQLAE